MRHRDTVIKDTDQEQPNMQTVILGSQGKASFKNQGVGNNFGEIAEQEMLVLVPSSDTDLTKTCG